MAMIASVWGWFNDAANYVYLVLGVVAVLGWVRAFAHRAQPAAGDPGVAAELVRLRSRRTRSVAAAVLDLDAETPCRLGYLGADASTRFEIGSISKALTGMLLADAIDRGEVGLDTTVADILPEHDGTPFGSVTLRELCTHTAGLPKLPLRAGGMWGRLLLYGLCGLDPYRRISAGAVIAVAARQPLHGRGEFHYSNLGGAVAGQLLALAAGTDYPTLLRQRLCDPVGLIATTVAGREDHAPAGRSAAGGRRQPWIQDGYAPAGGVIATIADLARLVTALLDGSAPGTASLRPLRVTAGKPGREAGMFWMVESAGPGSDRTMVWHNGGTGGYSAYLVLFPEARRAVAVLANLARVSEQQHIAFGLIAWMTGTARSKPKGSTTSRSSRCSPSPTPVAQPPCRPCESPSPPALPPNSTESTRS